MTDPNTAYGCTPCNCSLGGSLSAVCDATTGQCSCQPGLTGQTCSDIIPGYFIPSIDYLIFEAEEAVGAQVVIRQGFAYHLVTDENSSIIFGPLTPPSSGFYDIVIRYDLEAVLSWSSASLSVISCFEDVYSPTRCESTSEMNETLRLDYSSWPVGFERSVSKEIFLSGGRSYYFELNDFDSGQRNSSTILRIDSLVLIFVNSSVILEQLSTQVLFDYGQCGSFVRNSSTINVSDPSCIQTIFLVSTALYSGALSKCKYNVCQVCLLIVHNEMICSCRM